MEYIGSLQYDRHISKKDVIVICGAGKDMSRVIQQLCLQGFADNKMVACDNDESKWRKQYGGVEVVSYESALVNFSDGVFIVYNRYMFDILDKIKNRVKRIHMINIWA